MRLRKPRNACPDFGSFNKVRGQNDQIFTLDDNREMNKTFVDLHFLEMVRRKIYVFLTIAGRKYVKYFT